MLCLVGFRDERRGAFVDRVFDEEKHPAHLGLLPRKIAGPLGMTGVGMELRDSVPYLRTNFAHNIPTTFFHRG